jgi:hypothetical protein
MSGWEKETYDLEILVAAAERQREIQGQQLVLLRS